MAIFSPYQRALHTGGYEVIAASRVDGKFPWYEDSADPKSPLRYDHRYLVPKEAGFMPADKIATRLYDPMTPEHEFAYREFVELAGEDEAAIVAFADRYGQLTAPESWVGVRDEQNYVHDEAKRELIRKQLMGEALSIWEAEIDRLKLAFDLWQSIGRNDTDHLAKHIRVEEQDQEEAKHFLFNPDHLTLFTDSGEVVDSVANEQVANLTLADVGRLFLAKLLDMGLRGDVHQKVSFDPARGIWAQPAPRTLLSALWFRFYLDVQDIKGFRWCDFCGGEIRLERGDGSGKLRRGMYRNKMYCSDTCRVKGSPGYRAKHKPRESR